MKVYYAHCKSIYGTPQEQRDIELLARSFDVLNPSDPSVREALEQWKANHRPPSRYPAPEANVMDFFCGLVDTCGLLAFRALPDGRIPAGVHKEIMHARESGIPILELPCGLLWRGISVEQTREYLHEVGQR